MAKIHVAVRLEEDFVRRVDALGPRIAPPFMTARRSDVLRALLQAGLEVLEGSATKRLPRRPRRS